MHRPCLSSYKRAKDSRVCPDSSSQQYTCLPCLKYSHISSCLRTNNVPMNRKRVTQPWKACTREDAKPYKKYKKLFGERKFARDFVSTAT